MSKVLSDVIKSLSSLTYYPAFRVTPNSCRYISIIKQFNKKASKVSENLEDCLERENVSENVDKKVKPNTAAADYLKRTFNFDGWDLAQIAKKNKRIMQVSPRLLPANYQICIKNGIKHGTMHQHPLILCQSQLDKRIEELKKIPRDINVLAPLLRLPLTLLIRFVQSEVLDERIAEFTKIFEISEREVVEILSKKPFLISLNMEIIQENIRILKSFGITMQAIVKDLWTLRYSPHLVKERLELARSCNLEILKTWMVRCPDHILSRHIKRRSDNKIILGDNSFIQYLSDRLDCTEDEAKQFVTTHPALKSRSVSKIDEMIEFLFSHGFNTSQIKRSPKILLHSVETTRKRLHELENHGTLLEYLSILTKSQKQYLHHLELLTSNKG